MPEFEKRLDALAPITLAEMDAIKLMNRIDSKYLTDEDTLAGILSDAADAGYRAAFVNGLKIVPYDSIYYDTPQLKMFTDHQRGKTVRQKVRTRQYVSSGLTFLEIKRKNNKGRTKKKRIEIPADLFRDFSTSAEACGYLAEKSAFRADEISPTLETIFRRITLVNPARTERLTIDTALNFVNLRNGNRTGLADAVIIELKQDGRAASTMKEILLRHRVKPVRVSKYCIGTTMTDPLARSHRFKMRIRRIEKTISKKLYSYA